MNKPFQPTPFFQTRLVKPSTLSTLMVLPLLFGLYAPMNAQAAGDNVEPIEIEADSASYSERDQVYTLKGTVVLTQGSLQLTANEATVRVDKDGYQYAQAVGNAKIRQQRLKSNDFIEGSGQRIEYDTKNEKAALIGHAKLQRLEKNNQVVDQIEGDRITYLRRQEFYQVEKGATRQRVRAIISGGKVVIKPVK